MLCTAYLRAKEAPAISISPKFSRMEASCLFTPISRFSLALRKSLPTFFSLSSRSHRVFSFMLFLDFFVVSAVFR